MKDLSNHQEAVELLQQLGLKEYEAKCFVALTRFPQGTAKEISDISEVPRTRVYDAVRVLESKGLIEIQHSSPTVYRAVPMDEATETLRTEYESRVDSLVDAIERIEPAPSEDDQDVTHEVWSLTGATPIANRTNELIESATEEIVLVVGSEQALTTSLIDSLERAREQGHEVVVGTPTADLREAVKDALPNVEVFVSGLEWLENTLGDVTDATAISRLLLVDHDTILVSTVTESASGDPSSEKAVFGRGFDNGIVFIARRLMATGLGRANDPDLATD
jgi:sugar-specific transcriptional regulator TrmB